MQQQRDVAGIVLDHLAGAGGPAVPYDFRGTIAQNRQGQVVLVFLHNGRQIQSGIEAHLQGTGVKAAAQHLLLPGFVVQHGGLGGTHPCLCGGIGVGRDIVYPLIFGGGATAVEHPFLEHRAHGALITHVLVEIAHMVHIGAAVIVVVTHRAGVALGSAQIPGVKQGKDVAHLAAGIVLPHQAAGALLVAGQGHKHHTRTVRTIHISVFNQAIIHSHQAAHVTGAGEIQIAV